jgi:hypothetical protein
MESVAIGTALDGGVMLATFEAPIHYFERWIGKFDVAANSMTLSPPPKLSGIRRKWNNESLI